MPVLFFSYDPEEGFAFHADEASARARAAQALELARLDAAEDGWHDEADEICWGEVRQKAKLVVEDDAPDEGLVYESEAEYELTDVGGQ